MNTNPLFWLLITPMVCSVIVYIAGRIFARSDDETKANPAVWFCVASILITWIPFILTVITFEKSGPVSIPISDLTLTFDSISLIITGSVLTLGLAAAIFSCHYIEAEEGEEKFYGLFMILITAIIGLSTSTDLFNTYIWFELMATSTYALVGFYNKQPTSMEAAIKYLVQSAVGSALIILGIAITFGTTGEIGFAKIRSAATPSSIALYAAAACIFTGYGIKCAFVPMHSWLPDAHSQATSSVSAMLSGVVVETALTALLRCVGPISHIGAPIGLALLIFGVLNLIVGNLGALNQKEIKRMLAFSSISHIGYIAIGIGCALTFSESKGAASGAMFHIFNHAMMKGLAFLSAGAFIYILKLRKGDHSALMLDDINGASQKYPFLTFFFSIALLALGGLPPFSGFMSKWEIFSGGAASNNPWIIALMIFAGMNSVLSLGYYAPIVNHMYRHEQSDIVKSSSKEVPTSLYISLLLLTLFIVILGIAPFLISSLTTQAGDTLVYLFK